MATSQMSEIIHHLRRSVLLREGAGMTDGQLLENYISRHDGAAFEALARRRAPMVIGEGTYTQHLKTGSSNGVILLLRGNHHENQRKTRSNLLR